MRIKILIIGLLIFSTFSLAQLKTEINKGTEIITKDSVKISSETLIEKSPIRASLYSTILPGTGQLYNKKWIKAPIALGLVTTGIGFTIYYNNLYRKYRNAFIAVREGSDNEFKGVLTANQLAVIQDDYKRKRDYSIALTALAYLLNIVDATVDAHLYTIRKDKEMTLKPTVMQSEISIDPVLGLAFNFKF